MPPFRLKPYLYLDVDGLINAVPPLDGVEVFQVIVEGRRLPICIPPGTKERVARLSEAFEMVWATTWREHAHPTFAASLGLGEDAWDHLEYFGDYKLPAIVEHSVHHHMRESICMPWLWIDDRAEKEMSEVGIRVDGHRTLAIAPSLDVGMTDDHVAEALAFAERLNIERDTRYGS